jgi:hypothetical protein
MVLWTCILLKADVSICIWFRNAAQDARLVKTRADRFTGAKMGKVPNSLSLSTLLWRPGPRVQGRAPPLHTRQERPAHGAVACSLPIVWQASSQKEVWSHSIVLERQAEGYLPLARNVAHTCEGTIWLAKHMLPTSDRSRCVTAKPRFHGHERNHAASYPLAANGHWLL